MNRTVKTLVVITSLLFSSTISYSQLKLSLAGSIAPDVKKVIQDYPNNFDNLKGELIIENPQSADYQCNFKVTGAEEAIITRYSSTKKAISSWQALMLTTESFEEAKKKFKSLFAQLNNLSIKTESGNVQLKGEYEVPVEEKKFTTVTFSFTNGDDAIKKLKVEIVMSYELMEWKVKVLVYDREREDNERGKIVE